MFEYRNGAVWLDESRPGLGIELDHESAAEYLVDPGAEEASAGSVSGCTGRRGPGFRPKLPYVYGTNTGHIETVSFNQ